MREVLDVTDFKTFKPLDKKLVERVDLMLSTDITQLMQMLPNEDHKSEVSSSSIKSGAFDDHAGPFGIGQVDGINAGVGEHDWIVDRTRSAADDSFSAMHATDGKITGAAAKAELIKSKLPNSVLAKVWRLADYDKDGMLDRDEWALANYLIKLKLDGFELPNSLPDHLVPPSKRKLYPTLSDEADYSSSHNDTTSNE